MNARNILVICPDRRMLAETVPLVSQNLPLAPMVEITHYPERVALQELLQTKPPTLCFLDIGLQPGFWLPRPAANGRHGAEHSGRGDPERQ